MARPHHEQASMVMSMSCRRLIILGIMIASTHFDAANFEKLAHSGVVRPLMHHVTRPVSNGDHGEHDDDAVLESQFAPYLNSISRGVQCGSLALSIPGVQVNSGRPQQPHIVKIFAVSASIHEWRQAVFVKYLGQ